MSTDSIWRPMEAAPKDRRILLRYEAGTIFSAKMICAGRWNSDQYAKKPKPYWDADVKHAGVAPMRENPPSGWMELPE